MFRQVLEHIARYNGVSITLKLEDLQAVSGDTTSKPAPKLSTSIRNAFSILSLYVVGHNVTKTIIADSGFAAARISARSFLAGVWQSTRLS
jgi:hypothetical protein